jgi:hypothetical protein
VTQSATPEPLPREKAAENAGTAHVDAARLRASDADREAVAERLRLAHADGRLDLAEFDERVAAAYAARTYADLAPLTADLPTAPLVPPLSQTPDVRPRQPIQPVGESAPRRKGGALAWRIVGSAWFFASSVNLLIWAIVCIATMDWVYPWWIWVAGPWGAVLVAGWLSGLGRDDRDGDH